MGYAQGLREGGLWPGEGGCCWGLRVVLGGCRVGSGGGWGGSGYQPVGSGRGHGDRWGVWQWAKEFPVRHPYVCSLSVNGLQNLTT